MVHRLARNKRETIMRNTNNILVQQHKTNMINENWGKKGNTK